MLSHEHEVVMKEALSHLSLGTFSVLDLQLPLYEAMTDGQKKGFGKSFYHSVAKGIFNTADCEIVRMGEGAKPQRYEKRRKSSQARRKAPAETPVLLEESSLDISASLSDTLRLLKLVGKTLAIVPIDDFARQENTDGEKAV